MWELYATFAPKPLLLLNGRYDHLFPADLSRRMMRKVRGVYTDMGASNLFSSGLTDTKHSWETADIDVVADFFCRHFSGAESDCAIDSIACLEAGCRFAYPEDAVSTNRLTGELLGIEIDEKSTFADTYPPVFRGEPVERERLAQELFKHDPWRILAQMEIALTE